ELLKPVYHIDKIHAILLTGGSAFGLDACGGVMQYLEEKNIGYDVGITKVPAVPGAVLFDLGLGDFRVRPDREMGYQACVSAHGGTVEEGNVGAGTGASVGKIFGMDYAMKSGLGSWAVSIEGGITVGAIVAVNALGDVFEPYTDKIIAGAFDRKDKSFMDAVGMIKQGKLPPLPQNSGARSNTTLAVVATNAHLTKEGATKVAQMAHDGLARTISPVHTMHDGDTVFALSLGDKSCDISMVGAIAAEVLALAVTRAVKLSHGAGGLPSYKDINI
ncbi:MAG TPA: P1 family peptidase, partial [Clostridia bacterium]|nr:P1 family peptidase [Clostridia bacterium]